MSTKENMIVLRLTYCKGDAIYNSVMPESELIGLRQELKASGWEKAGAYGYNRDGFSLYIDTHCQFSKSSKRIAEYLTSFQADAEGFVWANSCTS